jgi:putative transposase
LLAEKAAQLDTAIETMDVLPDHVHLFVSYPPIYAVAPLVNQSKGYTSRGLRQEFPPPRSRLPSL